MKLKVTNLKLLSVTRQFTHMLEAERRAYIYKYFHDYSLNDQGISGGEHNAYIQPKQWNC